MGTLEQAHQRMLLKEHQARLDVLELRMAREGYDVDPAVVTEADQIRASIARLKDALNAPLPERTVQALSPDDRYQGNVAWQMRVEAWMYKIEKSIEKGMGGLQWQIYVLSGIILLIVVIMTILVTMAIQAG